MRMEEVEESLQSKVFFSVRFKVSQDASKIG